MIRIWCWIVGHDWNYVASYQVCWGAEKSYACHYKECNRCGATNKPEVNIEVDEEW